MLKTFLVPIFAAAFFALVSAAYGADVAPTSDTPKVTQSTSTNPVNDPDAKNAPRPQEQGADMAPPVREPLRQPAVTSGTSWQSGHNEPTHHDQNVRHVEPPHHDPSGAPLPQGSGNPNPFVDSSGR